MRKRVRSDYAIEALWHHYYGPTPSDLGEWEATVTYELQATGTYFSEKYGEQRCINNVQLIEDKIVGTSDGGGRIKSHKRVQELSNACKY